MQVYLYLEAALYFAFCPSFRFSLVESVLCAEWGQVGKWEHGFTAFFRFIVSLYCFTSPRAFFVNFWGLESSKTWLFSALQEVQCLDFLFYVYTMCAKASVNRMQYVILTSSFTLVAASPLPQPRRPWVQGVWPLCQCPAVFTYMVSHWNLSVYSIDCFCWSAASCWPCPDMVKVQPIITQLQLNMKRLDQWSFWRANL